MKEKTPPPSGLRARKRAETRARIIEAALKLFVKRGFDGTTLDDIAADAGISRRTFFHYFESKEDLAFAWLDSSTDDIVAAVGREDAGLPMLTMAANAMLACATPFPRAEAFALARLVNETPALRDRSQMKYGRLEAALAEALAARKGLKKDDLKARLAAMTAAGALRVASQRWYESGGKEDRTALSRRVLKALAGALEG
ncbi:MAG TPA: TetR family transcriptional regulator [Rhizomicrobium sp.]